jgi:hypothetical protein
LSSPSPNVSHRGRQLWRQIANGHARVLFGKGPAACSFASLQDAYALDDAALLAAINSHPLHAGWPEYDDKPHAEMPA